MANMPSSLPTPRELLTSLLNAISDIQASPPTISQPPHQQATATGPPVALAQETPKILKSVTATESNPLRLIPPAQRPLLATLHVLFPSLLLPALDLLDRGLVSRLIPVSSQANIDDAQSRRQQESGYSDMTSATGINEAAAASLSASSAPSQVYQVQSAQRQQKQRQKHQAHHTFSRAGDTYYVVHTAAWSCTCAAFAFAAHPSAPLTSKAPPLQPDSRGVGGGAVGADDPSLSLLGRELLHDEEDEDENEDWTFGGYAHDGSSRHEGHGAVPPCCKHLLACVLAERWDAVLGRYVHRRAVGREEMAGVFAGI